MITLLNTQFALRTMDARRAATVPALVTFWKPPTYLRREAVSGRQGSSVVILPPKPPTYLKLSSCPKLSAL